MRDSNNREIEIKFWKFPAGETTVYYAYGCIQETESFAEVKKRAMSSV